MGLDFDFSRLDAQDALDLAIFVEEEARDHYEYLVKWMESQGNSEAAEFFRKMARWEVAHLDQVTAQRKELFGDAPARYASNVAWEVEAPDYDAMGKKVSLEEAFEIARGAETRARDYYAGALEYASDPKLVEILEGLRDAEIHHLKTLDEWEAKLQL
jgi:rubrerythrin